MKKWLILFALLAFACAKRLYVSNVESIYRSGRNLSGEKMLDKKASRIALINSCQGCHGKTGDRMRGISIRFSALSDPKMHRVPYNDTLFYRFLDRDLKSDGTKADIGVIWKMSDRDKKDLLDYLKSL